MFPQTNPSEARYIAEIILSVVGVLLLMVLVFWLIGKRKKSGLSSGSVDNAIEPKFKASLVSPVYAERHSLTPTEIEDRQKDLEIAFRDWQRNHLISGEDGKSLLVRTGVEKNGLRYQLSSTAQVQALAMIVMCQLAEIEAAASSKTEALFASLLAHPAYNEPELTSWKFLPDLPRSPRLDANPQAEAWIVFAIHTARSQWPGLNRFNYQELLPRRLESSINLWQDNKEGIQPQTGVFLLKRLSLLDAHHAWLELIPERLEWEAFTDPSEETCLTLFQLGLDALLDQEEQAVAFLHANQDSLIEMALTAINSAEESFQLSWVASLIPAIMALENSSVLEDLRQFLIKTKAGKDDGLGATLQVFALALLANMVWL